MELALLQTDLFWENIPANLANLEEKVWAIKDQVDVIVLPEMFSTGFTMNAEALAEPMNLTTFKWIKQMAAQTKAAVTGSYIVKENGFFYNRLIWMQPDGKYWTYDKRHLFSYAGEEKTYKCGNERLIVEWKGWKFCLLICYDLRFPVWSRNDAAKPYDCLIFVANWPERRIEAWNALLKARAIENVSYVAGVNRVGDDGNNVHYNGDTSAYDFLGNPLAYCSEREETLFVTLDKKALDGFRDSFPALGDGDAFCLL